jgi:hydroxymethylpyrimidine pyrophosphatase-like HAD family hydrolase
MYVTQNGAAAYHRGTRLFFHPINKDLAQQIVDDIHQNTDCDCMVSTERGYYITIPESGILNNDWDRFPYEVKRVHNVYDVEEEICQVTLFHKDKAHEYAEHFILKWKDHLEVAITSEDCIDFSPRNKGEGLLELCQQLQIEASEVMAFGNSYNDISMLKLSGVSYIMANSPELLRRQFKNQCRSVEEVLKSYPFSI